MTGAIDLKQASRPEGPDVIGLQAYLTQLIGEPFLSLRFSYGDELTLHLGAACEAKSSKLKNRVRGSYILSARASAWLIKSEQASMIVSEGLSSLPHWQPITPQEIESREVIERGARIIAANPFIARPTDGFGLLLGFSDDSTLLLAPTIDEGSDTEDLPEVADWELLTPHGMYLRVGPSLKWEYLPARAAAH